MSNNPSAAPTYASAFQCIGPQCEDTCCRNWAIPVDRHTYEKYRQFPPERLGSVVSQHVSIVPRAPDPLFALINLAPSGDCAFLAPDRLCSIQREYGPELLSATCSIYPRVLNQVDGQLEGSLHLSCPEAARNILLDPGFLNRHGDMHADTFRTDSVAHLAGNHDGLPYKPYAGFPAIRNLILTILHDRARSIEQRILLIGAVCEQLHQIDAPRQERALPGILATYHQVIEQHQLIAELDALPTAHSLQLDVILKLMSRRLRDPDGSERFAETCRWFLDGIGYQPAAGSSERTDAYTDAHLRYYQPFFAGRPHILENYLLNFTTQTLFPFGRAGSPHFHHQPILDEYILFATTFAWIRALLIGAAGFFKESFAEEHVVHIIQSFCRATEHQPSFLISINQAIRDFKLDTPSGMAVLLRL